jgi:hypothetical protein
MVIQMKKKKPEEKINKFERKAYVMPISLRMAAARAKKDQPELIAISGALKYIRLDKE